MKVEDDDCALRIQLLAETPWSPVTGTLLEPGTYGTPPLSIGRMRSAALAEGFRRADVDDYLAAPVSPASAR